MWSSNGKGCKKEEERALAIVSKEKGAFFFEEREGGFGTTSTLTCGY